MSVSGICSSSLIDYYQQSIQGRVQQFRSELPQLGQDSQTGNSSAVQQDVRTVNHDFQNKATQVRHHHHHGGGGEISQLLSQLGQALQSGDLSDARTAYSTLQQDLQQFEQNHPSVAQSSAAPSGNGIAVNT